MQARTEEFSEKQQSLAALAKLLSHPARIAIVELLAHKRSCLSGSIADELPLSRPTVSQHLQELKRAGAISGEIEGKTVCYCLNPEFFARLQPLLNAMFAQVEAFASDGDTRCCADGKTEC